jgi:hypothetical protein
MTFVSAYHGATSSGPFVGYIRPDSDVQSSDWAPTPLWQEIDDNSDLTFVYSSSSTEVWPSYNTYDFECGLSSPTTYPDVGATQGMILRVRLSVDEGNLPGTLGGCDFTYSLKQGTSTIASNTYSASTLATPVTSQYTLSASEVNSITNHNDLRVFVTVNIGHASGDPDLQAQCHWAEVQYYAR